MTVLKALGQLGDLVTDRLGRQLDIFVQELPEPIRNRFERQLGLVVLGAPQVRDEHQGSAALAQFLDRRQGGADPRVVSHLASIKRDVEVDAYQDPLAPQIA